MKKLLFFTVIMLGAFSLSAQKYIGSKETVSTEQRLNDMYCTGMFKSADGVILDIENDITTRAHLNILNWLPGRVAGLQVYRTASGLSIPVIRGNIPGVFVDEIPVTLSFLDALNVNDIAIVKVIKTPFLGGFNGGGGAIAIYTLDGDEEEEEEVVVSR